MTDSRATIMAAFLDSNGWGGAQRAPLAGDASNRRYERLRHGPGGAGAVLMDADPAKGEDIRPFQRIARHLLSIGLSAPQILAADEADGLMLLEDFGDALFARLLAADPGREQEFYLAAVDALVALHNAPLPQAPDYGIDTMLRVAGLAHDWYGFGATDKKNDAGKQRLHDTLFAAFSALPEWEPVLVLRDFHAENLFWLPGRDGAARVGLIDFQDAGIGHPAYDLVSLGRDVRRDVSPETEAAMRDRYARARGLDPIGFALAAATLSAQRNLRILGVFARLSMHFGKAHYVDLIPRTWANLMRDLSHPGLAPLARTVTETLPAPSPSILRTLKDKCATIPNP